jgi:hypothetical protein
LRDDLNKTLWTALCVVVVEILDDFGGFVDHGDQVEYFGVVFQEEVVFPAAFGDLFKETA